MSDNSKNGGSGRGYQSVSAAANRRQQQMPERDFKQMCDFIYEECGIKLSSAKKSMLEARLQKRLRALDLDTYSQYCQLLFTPKGRELELVNLIDAVTTNTTEFFREPQHFELLKREVLPGFVNGRGGAERLRIWSAGCSSGEEPYTLAMVLTEFAEQSPGFRFSILATDISTQVISRASNAVYPEERVKTMNMERKKKFLLRSRNRDAGLVRIAPELRKLVQFKRLNFMEEFSFDKPMHIIFCRNVIIYFDRKTQENLLGRFCENLIEGGHLFIGHSESTTGMDLPLVPIAPTVYRKVR